MNITFLGQQTWMISDGNDTIIVDPLLTDTFGTSEHVQFRVYPPRAIILEEMPKISAIFITNEHLDHFHVKSMQLLDKCIPVYVGKMMPDCVKDTIRAFGFTLYALENSEVVTINNLKARFYIGKRDVPSWEKRVYQLYITDKNDFGVFIQSDTLMGDLFINKLKAGLEPQPKVFIASNNSQLSALDRHGALDNLLPLPNPQKSGLVGINILEEILSNYTQEFDSLSHIFMCGSGYIVDRADSKPFLFSDLSVVNTLLEQLSIYTKAQYLLPGQRVNFANEIVSYDFCSWVVINQNLYDEYKNRATTINQNSPLHMEDAIFSELNNLNCYKANKEIIDNELSNMAKCILMSKFGRCLLSTNEYLNGHLGPHRFVINLILSNNNFLRYFLNVNTSKFELILDDTSELLMEVPYGVNVYLGDFIALLNGKIQIWELCTVNLQQWYLGDVLNSPVAFMYSYFSEQVRPDLAYKVYDTIIS